MLKYLLVTLVVGLGLWMLLARTRGARRPTDAVKPRAGQPAKPAPQAMLACAHCGLHLPAGDAVQAGALVYCSDAHRARGPRPDPHEPGR